MKILHREIESCMSCPFIDLGGDTTNTIIGCTNREAEPGCSLCTPRTILKQPLSYVVADVDIPDWCPLPDVKDSPKETAKHTGRWATRVPSPSLMDVIVDEAGEPIIRVYEKGVADEIVIDHNARVEKDKPTILDEEWEIQGMSGKINNYRKVVNGDGWVVAFACDGMENPIAALPDALRVLHMIANLSRCEMHTDDEEKYYRILITERECNQIDDALKKASLEVKRWPKQ